MSKKSSEYTLILTFTGTKGIPPNLKDLKDILNSLKAADWIIEYKFTYTTFAEMKKYTHAELSKYTHNNIRNNLGGINS